MDEPACLRTQFEQVATLLRTMDTDALWNAANDGGQTLLINEP